MRRQMKLWDKKDYKAGLAVKMKTRVVGLPHTCPYVSVPLAGYVVGDDKYSDPAILEAVEKHVVHVQISGSVSTRRISDEVAIPLAFLKITNATWSLHVMACTVNRADSRGCGASQLSVRVIHGAMHIASTSLE